MNAATSETPRRSLFNINGSCDEADLSMRKPAARFVSNDKENCVSPPLRHGSLHRRSESRCFESTGGCVSPPVVIGADADLTRSVAVDEQRQRRTAVRLQLSDDVAHINVEIDRMLDNIAAGVSRLDDNAKSMKFEVGTVQTQHLEELRQHADREVRRTSTANLQVASAISAVDRDRIVAYSVCCVLFVGVVLGILAVLKVFD